ncbi:MAG: 4Fe-4S binding protein [Gammaproteobacteria bacterium]|nr:4Fe-4S binding protein [Gammaproteobacteria bacterium]
MKKNRKARIDSVMPHFTETAIKLYSRLFGTPQMSGQLPDGVETVLDGNTAVAITEAAIADSAALGGDFPGNGANTAWRAEQQRNLRNMFGGQLGQLDTESGHGALAAAIGLALGGQRATAFLDGQQLAAAQGLLINAVGRHLPLVVHLTNRALASQGAALGSGHQALHLSAESGCFVLQAMNVQQAVDFTLIARRVAELSLIPGIVAMDNEQTALAAQEVKLPSPRLAKQYLGGSGETIEVTNSAQGLLFGAQRRRVPKWHDLDQPVLSGALQGGESFALGQAAQTPFFAAPLAEILDAAFAEFARLTGRSYSAVTRHQVEKSKLLLVAQGAAIETAIAVSDELRRKHKLKVGVVGLHALRPLPAEQLIELLRGKRAVTVLERCDTPLATDGPLLRELRAASVSLGDSERPRLLSAIYGIGGLPLRATDLIALVREMGEKGAPCRYLGLDFHRASSHPKRQVMLDTLRRHYPQIAGLGLRSTEDNTAPGQDELSVAIHHLAGEPGEGLAFEAASFLHQLLGGSVRSRPALGWERWGVARVARFSHSTAPLLDGGEEKMATIAILSGDPHHPNIDPVSNLAQHGSLLMLGDELPANMLAAIKQKQITVYGLTVETAQLQEAQLGALIALLLEQGRIDLKPRRILTAREESFSHLAQAERKARVDAFEAGMASVRRIDTDTLQARPAASRSGWSDEAPLAVRHLGGDREGYDSLPRFWDEVGVLYKNSDGDALTADPNMASGTMPPLSATFCDHTPSRTALPLFNADHCTGCGNCWSNCPDSAIGAVALSPKKLIDTGIRIASADALRQVGSKLAQRIGTMARKGEAAGLATGELLQQAYDWLREKAPLPAERQQAVDADFIKVKAALAPLPLSVTAPLFTLAEQAQKESGELLSLAINPDACKACGLCAELCAEEALSMEPQSPERVAAARARWQLWQQTPDTDSSTIERVAKLPEVGPMAAIMLSRHCAFALSGGDGAEAGSGEKIAVRQLLAATEYQQQPLLHRFISEIRDAQQGINQQIRDTLADALPSEDLERLSAGLKAIHTREAGLGAFLQDEAIEGSGVDTHELRKLVQVAQQLGELYWRLSKGEHGLGRARFGLVFAPGPAAAWAGAFPHNPFQAPVVIDMSGSAPQVAAGLLQGQLQEAVASVRLLRQARALLEPKAKTGAKASDLDNLSWGDLTAEERQLCPPLILIGNDESLGGQGFAQLAWLLNSELPVKVLLLGELDLGLGDANTATRLHARRDSRANLGMMALAQRKAFVAQCSIAAPGHLRQSVREALRFTGPALLSLYAPSPERHGFAATATLQQAESALLSRSQPLFRYSPEGEGVFGSRLTLEGNPALKDDWYQQEGGAITPAHWALGQQRFAPRLPPLAGDAPAPTELTAWLALDDGQRAGRSPYLAVTDSEGNSQRLGIDPALATASANLAHAWRTLQELAGLVTPFTARVKAEAKANLAAAHQAELDALRAGYEEQLRELEAGMAASTHEQITARLVELAGYKSGQS